MTGAGSSHRLRKLLCRMLGLSVFVAQLIFQVQPGGAAERLSRLVPKEGFMVQLH
jgi:hypothetical protein